MDTIPRLFSGFIATVLLALPVIRIHACSTVLLREDNVLLVGHNLDETTDFKGFICINKRDNYKVGSTWKALRTYSNHLPYSFNWISQYGSITWSSIGRDLPDAGVNEAGLVIEEMSLAQHPYPPPFIQPRLFQMQWIQYHLDSFSTVEQVIESASVIIPDGWPWHFFIADKTGHCATIEYVNNKLVVHTGDALPVTALCNSTYENELERLKNYQGFGGDKAIYLDNRKTPRFVRAAHMLNAYDPHTHPSAVDYVFEILDNLGGNLTRRSYVVDILNNRAYFRTEPHAPIRHFSLNAFDFSCNTPVRILDMNTPYSGDVTNRFRDYTFEANRQIAASWINHVIDMYPDATEQDRVTGGFSTTQIDRYARYPDLSLAKHALQTPRNEYGLNTPYWAAYQGDLPQIQDLLGKGADVNIKTAIGITPLMTGAQAGHPDVVKHLLDKGADIDLTDRSGNTALITAIVFGQSDVAATLVQTGADATLANRAGWTPLHYAAANGDLDVIKLLLRKGIQLESRSKSELTALMSAAATGKLAAVQILLAEGADPNAIENQGNSPLLIAVLCKHAQVAQALIQAGADVVIQNNQTETPWSVAVANKDKKIMALLKAAGAKPPSKVLPIALAGTAASVFALLLYGMTSKKRQTNKKPQPAESVCTRLRRPSSRIIAVGLNVVQLVIGITFIAARGLPVDKLEWLAIVIWFSVPIVNLRAMTRLRQHGDK